MSIWTETRKHDIAVRLDAIHGHSRAIRQSIATESGDVKPALTRINLMHQNLQQMADLLRSYNGKLMEDDA